MASVSKPKSAMTLNDSPVEGSTKTSSSEGGDDLSRGNGSTMGKRMKEVSTDVVSVLQAPHVMATSMRIILDKLLCRMVAIDCDLAEVKVQSPSARACLKAVILNAGEITAWYQQLEEDDMEDDFETQQDVTVDPQDQMNVMVSNIGLGFATCMEESSIDEGNSRKAKKADSYNVAANYRTSNVIPSSIRSLFDKMSSEVLALEHDTTRAESMRHFDSASDNLEALLVDLQYVVSWFQQQEEGDCEAHQVTLDSKDDASQLRGRFAGLLSACNVTSSRSHC